MIFHGTIANFPPFKDYRWDLKPGVNYLVGPNGAGKTRIIDAIKDGSQFRLIQETQVTQRRTASGHLSRSTKKTDVPYMYMDWQDEVYDDLKEANKDYQRIDKTLEHFEQGKLNTVQITQENTTSRDKKGRLLTSNITVREHQIHGVDFNGPNMLSKGTQFHFNKFNWKLPNVGHRPVKYKNINNIIQNFFIFLEEPENSLHPNMQKKLPEDIGAWFEINRKPNKNIFLIITTHSPFVLKGLEKGPQTKQHCFIVDKDNSPLIALNHHKALAHGSSLLGVGLSDLVPGRIIIAENSVAKLIETIAAALNIDVPSFFVCSNGDGNTDSRVKNVQSLQKLLAGLSRDYPERFMLKLSYIIIYDDEKKKQESEEKLAENPTENLDIIYENLGKECLEDIYPIEWVNEYVRENFPDANLWGRQSSYTEYCQNALNLEGRDIGTHKESLAIYIGKKITSMDMLKKEILSLYSIFQSWS